MPTLTAIQRKNLDGALRRVEAALPAEHHRWLMPIWRRPAWQLNDPEDKAKARALRQARGRLYRALPQTARADWRWILKVLPDAGGWHVLREWANDTGRGFRTSS